MAIAGVKPDKAPNVLKLAKAILPYMTAEDNDAVGYAAIKDRLCGERWLNVNQAFGPRSGHKLYTKTNERLEASPQQNSFGDRFGINTTSAMILHARYATCGKGIENTHPFVSEDGKTALIHNGVIGTRGLEFITSTCDSEGILNEYLKHDVSNNPDNIQKVFNKLTGAFACAVLTEDSNGKRYLDLFRNAEYPTLFCSYVSELGTMIFCTKPDMLENAVKDLGWSMETMHMVKDNSYIRMDAKTGEYVIAKEVKKERIIRLTLKKKKGKKK